MKTVQCPAEGCDYTNPPRSVQSHFAGKADEPHRGKLTKLLEEKHGVSRVDDLPAVSTIDEDPPSSSAEPEESSSDESTPESVEDPPSDEPAGDGGDNPLFDDDAAHASAGAASGGGGSSTVEELPCGHESVDVSDAPEEKIVDGKIGVRCSECHEVFNLKL